MDFTFLIVTVLMLLAAQSGNIPIVIALFALLLVTAKSKYLILAAIIGLVLSIVASLQIENKEIYMLGGLFLILIIIAKADSSTPQQPYAGGGYY
ncbi:MAG: hypothetical protein ABIG96_02500 [Candidatus Micrarchaeota archaeon]